MLLNENLKIKELGFMVDCSRGAVLKVSTIKSLVDYLAKFDYTYLMLYTEDTYEIDNEPYFGQMRGRYTKKEIKEIDQYCQSKNIELIPCIETLAHLGRLLRHRTYNNLFDIDDILLVKDEQVYVLIDKMLKQISESFSSKKIHIGMDEAWKLGRGKYLEKNGYQKVKEIMEFHLDRVSKIAEKYGFECTIWADMVRQAYNEQKENFVLSLPDNITPMQWRYYPMGKEKTDEEIRLFNYLCHNKLSYAGGITKWIGFVPCNIYSFISLEEQIETCIKYHINNFLVTAWGDGAADSSVFSILPGIYFASIKAHGLPLNEKTKKYFEEVIKISFDKFLDIDLPNQMSNEKDKCSNISFMHLYNDVLQSNFYEIEDGNCKKHYLETSKKLASIKGKFSYIFKSVSLLCEIDYDKCNLGKRIYESYQNRNDIELRLCIETINKIIINLKRFMKVYEKQWLKENKTFGYEKQIIRLGGLLERMKYTKRIIVLYLNKKISVIDELEEKHLPSDEYDGPVDFINSSMNSYVDLVSGGSMRDF